MLPIDSFLQYLYMEPDNKGFVKKYVVFEAIFKHA